jgi:hypothetical protein
MIYRNKGSTKTIQPKPAAMAVQRALMHRQRRPRSMYLQQMRSLNKILFTDLYQFTIHTPPVSRSKYTMTCLSAHKQQTHPYREQHGNQSFMYVSYGRHDKPKIGNYSLRKA